MNLSQHKITPDMQEAIRAARRLIAELRGGAPDPGDCYTQPELGLDFDPNYNQQKKEN